jgi:ATP-dependent HslUV protease ATP-binding subunit HslU
VGRDVESIIRDLVELSVSMVKAQHSETVREKASKLAEDRLLDLLLPPPPLHPPSGVYSGPREVPDKKPDSYEQSREKLRQQLREGKLDERSVELEVKDKSLPPIGVISNVGMEDLEMNLREMLGNMMPGKSKKRRLKVAEALSILHQEEAQKLIDMDEVIHDAVNRVENAGIVFLDEIDKVASRSGGQGPDVSREGVQRDLLPIVEGSTINTKYGMVKTDHILFIAAGAFHMAKPSDLIPELQGRFPIRVELSSLGKEDFVRILTEPKNSLEKQYVGLLETEGVNLAFTKDGIEEIAETAVTVNGRAENIGARRLFTIMERLLEKISFAAPELEEKKVVIDAEYVRGRMQDIIEDEDLTRYIL